MDAAIDAPSEAGSSDATADSGVDSGIGATCSPLNSTMPTYPGTVQAGAKTLSNNYQSFIGSGGYAYAYGDSTSPACNDSASLCVEGSAAADLNATVHFAGLGVDLNQAVGSTAKSTLVVPASDSGISYAIAGTLPTTGLVIVIDAGGTDYCAPIVTMSMTTTGGAVPWSSFHACTAPFTALAGPPDAASHVQIQVVNASSIARPFDFCVTALGFAPCTLAPNTCPAGGTCVTSGSSTACMAPGTGAAGSLCTGDSNCAAGLNCLAYSGAATGVCKPWCQISPTPTSCNSGACIPRTPGLTVDNITYGYCSTPCDLAPNTCGAGENCIPVTPSSGSPSADCSAAGPGTLGSPCTFNPDCVAGLGCFGPAGSASCKPWCQLIPTPTACTAGSTCTAVVPPAMIGGITYGDCP